MGSNQELIALEHGIDLRQLTTTGSLLHISEDLCDAEERADVISKDADLLGQQIKCWESFIDKMKPVDKDGYVKKKIIEEGGGKELHSDFTVDITYTGYFENDSNPFDVRTKPFTVDLKDNGLLPGLLMAVQSMLVGEISVFHMTYQVMFGELGCMPRIKPKANCIFYVKLIRSIIMPAEGPIYFSEPNMFGRVSNEVKKLYLTGFHLFKCKNYMGVIQRNKKAIYMLDKVRLADEEEEKVQKKLLIKLYTGLAINYNLTNQPLRACTACNEINRLKSIWKEPKILYQNAKALRMIGSFNEAQRKLLRAMKLNPKVPEMENEWELLQKTRETCHQKKVVENAIAKRFEAKITDEFKTEIDTLIKSFKANVYLSKLTLPPNLNSTEVEYIKEVCFRENVFCNDIVADDVDINTNLALDKEELTSRSVAEDAIEDDIDALF